jgi:hypothetical protein
MSRKPSSSALSERAVTLAFHSSSSSNSVAGYAKADLVPPPRYHRSLKPISLQAPALAQLRHEEYAPLAPPRLRHHAHTSPISQLPEHLETWSPTSTLKIEPGDEGTTSFTSSNLRHPPPSTSYDRQGMTSRGFAGEDGSILDPELASELDDVEALAATLDLEEDSD